MGNLNKYERKGVSQWGEDGITLRLLSIIGYLSEYVVEIGFGEECCTGVLLHNGWRGLLLDSDPDVVRKGVETWPKARIIQYTVTPMNVNPILKANAETQPDLLAIDIDGMDYHVWKGIRCVSPRIVIVEYNASLGPAQSLTVSYIDGFDRMSYDAFYHGASLEAMRRLGDSKGYGLVACESHGINAFFVRRDLLKEPLEELSSLDAYYPHAERMPWPQAMRHLAARGLALETV